MASSLATRSVPPNERGLTPRAWASRINNASWPGPSSLSDWTTYALTCASRYEIAALVPAGSALALARASTVFAVADRSAVPGVVVEGT